MIIINDKDNTETTIPVHGSISGHAIDRVVLDIKDVLALSMLSNEKLSQYIKTVLLARFVTSEGDC